MLAVMLKGRLAEASAFDSERHLERDTDGNRALYFSDVYRAGELAAKRRRAGCHGEALESCGAGLPKRRQRRRGCERTACMSSR